MVSRPDLPRDRLALTGAFLIATATTACGSSNTASALLKAPAYEPPGQTKASVRPSPLHPLIVEWPNADRGALEAQSREGLVPVRYVDGQMEMLPRCHAGAKYGYVPIEPKVERVVMRTRDDLAANIPVHAASFAGQLATSGALTVDIRMVGRYQTARRQIWIDELSGECDGVTHVVAALTVGAFDFFTDASATVGGGGGALGFGASAESAARRQTLNKDGDFAACPTARASGFQAPAGCGAILRLELLPVALASSAGSPSACASPDAAPCEQRCQGGSPVACAVLARRHSLGEGANKDLARAAELNQLACRGGYPVACANLGIAYVIGKGVERNPPRGGEILQTACHQGEGEACLYLGIKYMEGSDGFSRDPLFARDLFIEGCRNGVELSCRSVNARPPPSAR